MKLSKFIILLTSIFLISSCMNSNQSIKDEHLEQVTKEEYLARAQEAEKNDPYYKSATIDFKYQIKTGNKNKYDGIVTYKNQVIDRKSISKDGRFLPADYYYIKENAIISMTAPEIKELDIYDPRQRFGYDGNIVFLARELTEGTNPYDKPFWVSNYVSFKLNADDGVKVEIGFDNTDNLLNSHPADLYRFSITKGKNVDDDSLFYYLTDWIPYQQKVTLDLSSTLKEYGLKSVDNARIRIEALPKVYDIPGISTYMIINKIKFTCNKNTDIAIANKYFNMSFYNRTDFDVIAANKMGLKAFDACSSFNIQLRDSNGQLSEDSICYYSSTAAKYCYKAKIRLVDVTYDLYEHYFGERVLIIGGTYLQEYIDNGWCCFEGLDPKIPLIELKEKDIDLVNHPFKVINKEKCPVLEITKAVFSTYQGNPIWQFECTALYYRYLGWDNKPPKTNSVSAHLDNDGSWKFDSDIKIVYESFPKIGERISESSDIQNIISYDDKNINAKYYVGDSFRIECSYSSGRELIITHDKYGVITSYKNGYTTSYNPNIFVNYNYTK